MKSKNIFEYYWSCVTSDYLNFKGRARRLEFWGFIVVSIIAGIGFTIVDTILHMADVLPTFFSLNWILNIVVMIPTLAVTTRRFHDTDRSGAVPIISGVISSLITISSIAAVIYFATEVAYERINFFDNLTSQNIQILAISAIIFGIVYLCFGIYILVVCFLDGTYGKNKYGPDPKHPDLGIEIEEIGTE